jgi:hypothetical protein
LKLKLRKKQEDQIGLMFFQCTGLYNLIIRRIELSAKDKIYYSKYELFNQNLASPRIIGESIVTHSFDKANKSGVYIVSPEGNISRYLRNKKCCQKLTAF